MLLVLGFHEPQDAVGIKRMEVFYRFEHKWQYDHSILIVVVCYTSIDVGIVIAGNTCASCHWFDAVRPFTFNHLWIRLGVIFVLLGRQDIVLEIDASASGCLLGLVAIVQYVVCESSIACVAHVASNIGASEQDLSTLVGVCLNGITHVHRDATDSVGLGSLFLTHDDIHECVWRKRLDSVDGR